MFVDATCFDLLDMADINNKYVLEGSHGEVARLQKQHLWFQNSLNGQIVFAPLELQQPGLRVLDIGCADGETNLVKTNGGAVTAV